jgi:cell division protein FtsN
MKTFIVACVAAVIIAVIGGVVLNSMQEPVDKAFSTTGVRLGA